MITEQQVREAIHPVVDPELMLSILDLGLIYGVKILDEGKRVIVTMTLTSPMCPAGPQILSAVKGAVAALPGVEQSEIEVVWEPAWDPTTMATEEVKDLLGIW